MRLVKLVSSYATLGILLVAGLYSAIHTPLVADDFAIALGQSSKANESWLYQIQLSWDDINSGTHFNLIGALVSHFYVKSWIGFSSHFDLNLHWIFWALKLICFAFSIEVCARIVREILRIDISRIRIVVTIIFIALVQNSHTMVQ
jgi:hypothetical protein